MSLLVKKNKRIGRINIGYRPEELFQKLLKIQQTYKHTTQST